MRDTHAAAWPSGLRAALMASVPFMLSAGTTAAQQAPSGPNPPKLHAPRESVESIVVTAQRRREKLQNVPIAITAISATQLARLGITSSRELTQVTPALNFTQSVYSPQPTIRGIGTRGVGAGDESVVPVYIDGVYQSFIPGAIFDFSDVQRVEVLKGPQGALLGRNATGGAINVITKSPGIGPHADLDLSYGSYNEFIAKGFVSYGTEKIGADLAFVTDRDDGYIRDIARNTEIGKTDDVSVRGKVVAHPNERLDLTFAVSHTSDIDSTGEAYRVLDGISIGAGIPGNIIATAPYTAAQSFAPYNNLLQTDVAGTAVLHLDRFNITDVLGYQDSTLKVAADVDATPADLVAFKFTQYSKNLYDEIYATSTTSGPLSWIAGFVFYHDQSGYAPNIGVTTPTVDINYFPSVLTNSYAGYAQGTYKITDQLSITFGGRYTNETKTLKTRYELDAGDLVLEDLPLGNKATFTKFTPSGVIQYQPTSKISIYAKGGEAFKSGIFNTNASSPALAEPIRPETVTQYEVGAKTQIDPRLSLNLAGYYTDYTNLQSSTRDPVSQTSFVQNAGGATIYGMEAEVFAQPIDDLNLRFGVSALHGTYDDFPDADVYFPQTTMTQSNPCLPGSGPLVSGGNRESSCNVDGKTIQRTPVVTVNFGGDYTVPTSIGDVTLSGNLYYQGKSYWDTANVFEEKPFVLIDARLSWQSENRRYGAAVWGKNLTSRQYSLTEIISGAAAQQVLAKPRTVGFDLIYHF